MSNVRIAIQSRGKLADASLEFLYSLGLKLNPNGRNCLTSCENYPIDILFLRDDDIPKYVEFGTADFGIVGENVLLERNARVRTVRKLGFSACSLVIAALDNSLIQRVSDLQGKKIATSYPKLLASYLIGESIKAEILTLKGSVEIAPNLNMADAICDLTQTGRTLKENNLRIITTILESQAVLIQTPFITARAAKNIEDLLFNVQLKA